MKLLEGKKPKTIAAASIYTAFFLVESSFPSEVIVKKIEEIIGTKKSTLLEAYGVLYPHLKQLVLRK